MSSGEPPAPHPAPTAWIGVLLILATGLLWARTLDSPFLFDDLTGIEQNPNIESLTPLSRALDAPPGSGADGRPLVALSLALNYAVGERRVLGYHLFNIATHLLAGVLLLAVVRRGLALARGRAAPLDTALASAAALVWVTHPLHTAALNHVVYRNVEMAGLAYLATVYAALRVFAGGGRGWVAASALACAAGTGCKETLVSAPLVVLLLDRGLASGSFAAAWRARRGLYLALAASWPLLAWIVSTGDRGESVGFGLQGFSALDSLRTQASALVHYLRLALWPSQLSFDYHGWPIARSWSAALPAGAFVLAALAAALVALARGHILGTLATCVFLILAPTSSFVPLSGAVVAEHRVYLALVPLILFLGVLLARVGARPLALLGCALALGLGARTYVRNADFESEVSIWGATVEARPDNSRAWNNYGIVLAAEGRKQEAEAAYARVLALDPTHAKAHVNLANLLFERGDLEPAQVHYARAIECDPDLADAYYYLGSIALQAGREADAVHGLRQGLARGLAPRLETPAKVQLAMLLAAARDDTLRDGAEALRLSGGLAAESTRARPRILAAQAAALAELGRFGDALECAQRALDAARERGAQEFVPELEAQVESFRQRRPWRIGGD